MSDPEIYRRLGTAEEDTRKLYGAMSDLTTEVNRSMSELATEVKLMSQAMHTMHKTLEAMNSINSTMHDHDKRLISDSSRIENLENEWTR